MGRSQSKLGTMPKHGARTFDVKLTCALAFVLQGPCGHIDLTKTVIVPVRFRTLVNRSPCSTVRIIRALFLSTEQVLFRATSSSLECLSSLSGGSTHEKSEPMDSLENMQAVSSLPSRTVNGNKYVRIATSPFGADGEEVSRTHDVQTSGIADSFVRTPIVLPDNMTVIVSYNAFHVAYKLSCLIHQEPMEQCSFIESNTSGAPVMPRKSSLKRKSSTAEV